MINRMLERLSGNDYGQRWSLWRVFNIMDRNDPTQMYLKRLRVIQTPFFGFYVHWVHLPDSDRDLHDHPWNFWSFILRGGYTEVVQNHIANPEQNALRHRRGSLHRMTVSKGHKIMQLEPRTITLLLVGRRKRDWGFWTQDGWISWRAYDRSEGYGPDPFMS